MFLGNITFTNSGTLTRANGSDLGSFLDEGFRAGQLIRIGNAPGCNGDVYISSISIDGKVITLTTPLGCAATFTNVSVSRLTRSGIYDGPVTFVLEG